MNTEEARIRAVELAADVPTPGATHSGQVRMAYRLADKFKGKLLFVPQIGWHVWDRQRWALDDKGAATRAVLAVLKKALADSLLDQDLRRDVRKCEGASAIRGVLDIAATLEAFVCSHDDLDADPYLLNTANGTLDLRIMRLRPHDPADRITAITRGAFRPEETGGEWSSFLEQVLPDKEVRAFLQRVVGVSLLGKVVEHILPIWIGTGANGKSVCYGALLHALGDYAAPAEPELFTSREGAHPVGQMDLMGCRFVVVSESDKDRRLAEATMKRLTGGDRIKARHMRQGFVSFRPSHTAVLVTNHLPKVSGDDEAIWRRMRVVPFTVVVPEDQRDGRLGEHLELEADAVLAWAVAGYADYIARGDKLAEPDSVLIATKAYRTDSDALARFLDECCYVNPNVKVPVSDLYDRWERWSALDRAEPLNSKQFGQALDRRGLAPSRVSNGKRWRGGIALLIEGGGGS